MEGTPEFVSALQAARLLGISDATLRRRIRRGLLPVYTDVADRRFRLLKVSDLESLSSTRQIVPFRDGGET